jgi:hypothetical protein
MLYNVVVMVERAAWRGGADRVEAIGGGAWLGLEHRTPGLQSDARSSDEAPATRTMGQAGRRASWGRV